MSLFFRLSLLLVLSCNIVISAHELPPSLAATRSLEERLAGTAGLTQCWSALTELGSCTNEMVLFFINGDSYLTIDCCRAILVITQNCWPSLLDSLGFTSREADILRGYCDAETAAPPSPSSDDMPTTANHVPAPAAVKGYEVVRI